MSKNKEAENTQNCNAFMGNMTEHDHQWIWDTLFSNPSILSSNMHNMYIYIYIKRYGYIWTVVKHCTQFSNCCNLPIFCTGLVSSASFGDAVCQCWKLDAWWYEKNTWNLKSAKAKTCQPIKSNTEKGTLQTLGLPAANPAYPLTCSNPFVGFKLFTFQNNKHY